MKKYKYNIILDDSLVKPERILVDSAAAYRESGTFMTRNDTVDALSKEIDQIMKDDGSIIDEHLRADIYTREDPSDEWEFVDML
jgi:hypothetical protein